MYVTNFGSGTQWLPGVISQISGPVSFKITLDDGRLVRRHQDHVRKRTGEAGLETCEGPLSDVSRESPPAVSPMVEADTMPVPVSREDTHSEVHGASVQQGGSLLGAQAPGVSEVAPAGSGSGGTLELRRSGRTRRQPERLQIAM